MDVERAVKFPFDDPDWVKKILIGGVLSIIPVVNFIVHGYAIRTLRGVIGGEALLPEWDTWAEDFITGLKVFIISFVYMLIPLAIIFFSVGVGAFFQRNVVGGAFAGLGSLVGFVLILVIGFILPMALALFAVEDSVGAAFQFGEIIDRIKRVLSDYLVAYIVIVVLGFILGFIAAIPILGWLIALFGGFYILLVAARMFGELYAESTPA